jgi:hypothetical protein
VSGRVVASLVHPAGNRLALGLALLAGLVLILYSARLLFLVGLRYTDEDAAVFWHAALDFGHLQFHEPRFYGQDYNALLESLIAAPLVRLGFPVQAAVPSVAAALAVMPWLLLGWVAWGQRRPLLVLVLLAVPLALRFDGLLFASMPRGFFSGFAVASLGIPLAVCATTTLGRGFLLAFLVGLAASIGPNSVMLGGPLLLHRVLRGVRPARGYGGMVLGLSLAGVLHQGAAHFYKVHPDHVVFKLPELKVERALLSKGLDQLDLHFGALAPRLWPHGDAVEWAAVILCLFALLTWRKECILPALVIAAAPFLALAVNKAHSGHVGSVFLPHVRLFLGLPVAFACAFVMRPDGRGTAPRWQLGVVALLVAAAGWSAHASLAADVAGRIRGSAYEVPHRRTSWIVETCRKEMELVVQHRAELVVHAEHNAPAYACAALHYPELRTLFPDSERRTWRLREEEARTHSRVLFMHPRGSLCDRLKRAGARSCERVGRDPTVVLAMFEPAVHLRETMRAVGEPWR